MSLVHFDEVTSYGLTLARDYFPYVACSRLKDGAVVQ